MKSLKNKKGFTLVELLAVIVVLAIVMGLAVVGISSVLDNTRMSAFSSDAKTFIEATRSLVNSEQASAMLGMKTIYSPSCISAETVYIPIATIPLDGGKAWADQKSPYGVPYKYGEKITAKTTAVPTDKTVSYVAVKSTLTNGECTLTYGIYLNDSVKMIRGGTGNGKCNTVLAGQAMDEKCLESANVVNYSAPA